MPKLIGANLPIKRSEMEGKLQIPHAHVGGAQVREKRPPFLPRPRLVVGLTPVQSVIRKYASIHSENYTSDGLVMQVALVPGDFDAFIKVCCVASLRFPVSQPHCRT